MREPPSLFQYPQPTNRIKMDKIKTKKLSALIIGTSSSAMHRLKRLLGDEFEIEIESFTSLRKTILAISGMIPDLIFTEWDLNDLTAAELLKVLKSNDKLKNIPTLIVTNLGNVRIINRAKSLGAVDVLFTPVHQKILFISLEKHIPEITFRISMQEPEKKDQIRRIINQISSLPPLPALAKTVLELSEDPNSSARTLGYVIKKDQALTAKILKIVNSAYFGFYRKITNVNQAIVILGFNEIRNITVASSLINSFKGNFNKLFSWDEFWTHALGAAFIARSLGTLKLEVNSEDAFVAGLLHDIGKLVLSQHFQKSFATALKTAAENNLPLHEVSKDLMDMDHTEVGGMIVENWKLPKYLVRAIQYHHNPDAARKDEYHTHLAHLANYFCHEYKIGSSGNPVPDKLFQGSLEALGMQDKNLDKLWGSFRINDKFIKDMLY